MILGLICITTLFPSRTLSIKSIIIYHGKVHFNSLTILNIYKKKSEENITFFYFLVRYMKCHQFHLFFLLFFFIIRKILLADPGFRKSDFFLYLVPDPDSINLNPGSETLI